MLTARDYGDGFFSCSLADLEQADLAIKSVKALAKTEDVAPVPSRELHISAEERKRALAFMEWHGRQMHPSDRAAIVMFNNGVNGGLPVHCRRRAQCESPLRALSSVY